MTGMTGGEAIVRSLYREGARGGFGLPGGQLYGLIAALRDEPRIRFIVTRHEQATSYMADGYARASGDFGIALVVPGPGLLNAAAGRRRRRRAPRAEGGEGGGGGGLRGAPPPGGPAPPAADLDRAAEMLLAAA